MLTIQFSCHIHEVSCYKTMPRYDLLGYVEDLPELVVGRQGHGSQVTTVCTKSSAHRCFQVLLVAGGYNKDQEIFSSTELFAAGSSTWTITNPLPWGLYYMRGLTLGNVVYLTGELLLQPNSTTT